jgi:hypothetical protein
MIELRQRRTAVLAAMLIAVLGSACGTPQQSQSGAPATTIAAAQSTVAPAVTAAAVVQSTAAPGATAFAGAFGRLQPENVARLMGTTMGVQMTIDVDPPNVENTQVTRATLNGTDQNGAFGKLDLPARRSFASAGLQLARQAYPQAQLELTIVDPSGTRLIAVTQAPGGEAAFQ